MNKCDEPTGPTVGPDRSLVASVIIPHLNTPDLLRRCLVSVTAQRLLNGVFEIIVVDNGSRSSLDCIRRDFPDVAFMVEPNPGPGLARNTGAAAARSPILVFIDADCRAAPGWLQAAVAAIASDPTRAVAGGEIRIEVRDPARLTGTEAFETVFGFRQKMYIESKHFSVTANLAMGAEVMRAVGPFKGVEFAEDLEWGRRAWAAGFHTCFVPSMLVWHPARPDYASMTRKWKRLIDHEYRAHLAQGHRLWRWRIRAAALAISAPVDAARLMTSSKLTGFGTRLRGVIALTRIRFYRASAMLQATRPQSNGATEWNR